MATREARLQQLRTDITRGLNTAKRLPEFQSQVDELERRLEALKSVLPEQKDYADILRRVQTLATQSNLTIRGFQPKPVRGQADPRGVADRARARRHVPQPRDVLRSDQQVPANHQRELAEDPLEGPAIAELDDQRGVHRVDVRAGGFDEGRAGQARREADACRGRPRERPVHSDEGIDDGSSYRARHGVRGVRC